MAGKRHTGNSPAGLNIIKINKYREDRIPRDSTIERQYNELIRNSSRLSAGYAGDR